MRKWAQFGGGQKSRALPFFQTGNIICQASHFFSLGFVFEEVSKIKVMFVMFCVKSFSR